MQCDILLDVSHIAMGWAGVTVVCQIDTTDYITSQDPISMGSNE